MTEYLPTILALLATALGTFAAVTKVPFLRRCALKAQQAVSLGKETMDQWRAGDALYTAAIMEANKSDRLSKAILTYARERDETIAAAAALRKP